MGNPVVIPTRITKENQRFFLNTTEIPGIQSFRGGYNVPYQPMVYLGESGQVNMLPVGAQAGSFSISTALISNDLWIPLTGNTGFNGYVIQRRNDIDNTFGFQSGYLTSYTSSYKIGQIPTIEIEAVAFKSAGRISAANYAEDFDVITLGETAALLKIPGPGSVTLNLDEFTTNRVLGYDLSILCARNPMYQLGSRIPWAVEINYPIEVQCNFQIDLSDYQPKNVTDFPFSTVTKNLTLTVKTFDTDAVITTYAFNNLKLESEQYEATVDNSVKMNLQYKTFMMPE